MASAYTQPRAPIALTNTWARKDSASRLGITAHANGATLTDRIADQRAAQRDIVAHRLLEAGKQIFLSYEKVLSNGKAGPAPVHRYLAM